MAKRKAKAKAKKSKAKTKKKVAAKKTKRAKARRQKFTFSHHREEDFDAGLRSYAKANSVMLLAVVAKSMSPEWSMAMRWPKPPTLS